MHAIGETILGLDIGTNSVGWAVVRRNEQGLPAKILKAGVRVFPQGVTGDIESGRDESRAVDRRAARSRRRLLHRKARRMLKLAHLLQGAALLPAGDLSAPAGRHAYMVSLDGMLFSKPVRQTTPHTLLYHLRARALDGALSPHELGRAIYHLAQRRGYQSNRLSVSKEDEDEKGAVKEGIAKLRAEMKRSGARTLGEHFSKLDPLKERIRQRWTSRQMFLDEFEAIWSTQAVHHECLRDDGFKQAVHRAIFYQRPLKWDRNTIGTCDLELTRRRAPLALLVVQEFRLLQKVNDLKLQGIDKKTGETWVSDRLDDDQRNRLVFALEHQGDLTFPSIRRLLGLPRWVTFNFEEGGDTRLIGNRTAVALRGLFGPPWDTMPATLKEAVVLDFLSIQSLATLKRRAERVWQLDAESLSKLEDTSLEPGHAALSRHAIAKLLPLMRRGIPYATARKEAYGVLPTPAVAASLPRLDSAPVQDVRNPAVHRALSETRRVVNALVARFGKPAEIRIELARDLKKGRAERVRISKENLTNRKAREKAAQRLLAEHGIHHASRRDIEKFILWEECNQTCPYTGQTISGNALFGPEATFDVEHIIPFSRSLDNSYINKTLCQVDENRTVKKNRTPFEAYGNHEEKWSNIIDRVKKFQGHAADAKLERFRITNLDDFEAFCQRQLQDTRYASRLAIEYLGILFGSKADGVDADGSRCIQAGRGQVTKYLRDEWGLNKILGDGGEKNRGDHRHHAVDALCVALTDPSTVKALSDAAAAAERKGRRRFAPVPPPWPGFAEEARGAIEGIFISHRAARKVSGPMHEETHYGIPRQDSGGHSVVHVRKTLSSLSRADVEAIVDGAVRETVRDALGDGDPKKIFGDAAHHPRLPSGVPIHSVRIKKTERVQAVGAGARLRQVITGKNHHVEVFERRDSKGKVSWDGAVVSLFEAMQRLRAKRPVVQKDHGPGCQFLFSLCQGDLIQFQENGTSVLCVIRTVTTSRSSHREFPRLEFVLNRDAREKKEIKAEHQWRSSLLDPLRKLECTKVVITPTGEIRRARD